MATNNSINSEYTNNADGFSLAGGTTKRSLTVTGANITVTGSGSNTHTFPASTDTLVGRASTDTLTNKTIDGDDNTVQDLPYSAIKSTSRSGSDTTLITGTKGTSGDVAVWNADGDIVDGATPGGTSAGDLVTIDATQTLTNKTLTSPKINEDVAVTATASELNITDAGQTTEKVLNVQCKCRAYLSSSQSNLTNDTFVKINLNAESYDIGGDFDTVNHRFVAPVSGYYLVVAKVAFLNAIADRIYYAVIYVNGSNYSQRILGFPVNYSTPGVTINDIVYCAAGQYIELYALSSSGDNTVDVQGGANATAMAIHLLSI